MNMTRDFLECIVIPTSERMEDHEIENMDENG